MERYEGVIEACDELIEELKVDKREEIRTDDEFCAGCAYNTYKPIPIMFPKHLDEQCVECMNKFEDVAVEPLIEEKGRRDADTAE